MSFENPGFESFENKEKTKEQVIEEIKTLGGFESGEAKEVFGKWIDQEQEKVKTSDDGFNLNISIADVYRDVGDVDNAIDAYTDALDQAVQEGRVESENLLREELSKLIS
ncbi:MAG: hypothetical protein KBC42_01530 [Candidatus Pacebacteria bacterium]|nr:hypothetical protein [Candidatus Paceibacterota bacterium]MBP9780587.1 hypothetical protein [Candidatus Paceibacterota bacterium]